MESLIIGILELAFIECFAKDPHDTVIKSLLAFSHYILTTTLQIIQLFYKELKEGFLLQNQRLEH